MEVADEENLDVSSRSYFSHPFWPAVERSPSVWEVPPSDSQTYPLKAVIDSPASGTSFAAGAVDINYHASAQDGVAVVELSLDGQVLSSLVTPDSKQPLVSLKYTWQATVSGSHVIRVRAQSSKGEWSPFAESMVTIQGDVQQQQQDQQSGGTTLPTIQQPTRLHLTPPLPPSKPIRSILSKNRSPSSIGLPAPADRSN